MPQSKTLLVTGSTGKQGGAVIKPSVPDILSAFNIAAATRSTTSKSAQALASHLKVFLVEGDLDNPAAVFKQSAKFGVSLVSKLDL